MTAKQTPTTAGLTLRVALLFAALWLSWPMSAEAAPQTATRAAADSAAVQIVHLLDYLAVDYAGAVADGKIADAGEYAEMQEFARNVALLVGNTEGIAAADRERLAAGVRKLAGQIDGKTDAATVAALAIGLKRQAIAAWKLVAAPRKAPDLTRAATLYADHCAACHGSEGRGNGPLAKGLEPAPSDFFDRERMAQRSLYGLYNTITLGVEGTGMAAWPQLAEADRWALAFYIGGLAATADELALGEARWQQVLSGPAVATAVATINDLAALTVITAREAGPEAPLLAFLTRRPQALQALTGDPLAVSRRLLAESVAALAGGDAAAAQRLAVAAYLDGFELAEASLAAVDGPLVSAIEGEMIAFRRLVAAGELGAIRERAKAIDELLARAQERLDSNRLSPAAAGFSAFGILFREGLEAILVLAAISVGVARAGAAPSARLAIHLGWIAALIAGGITWLVADRLVAISGAAREMTEGVTALASAAILLYVGFWLHDKAHAEHWLRFLGDRVTGAVSRGALGLLAGVAFLAVYREAFETVLFFQALAAQTDAPGRPLSLGAALAAAALLAVAWAVFRGGMKLPLALFFRASSALLATLAVVFAGQGVAALQEAGRVGIDQVAFVSVPLLGVHPTVQTLGAQVLTLAIAIVIALRARRGVTQPH